MLFAPDLVGPSEQITEPDYRQIITDIAGRLGPLLGLRPAA